MKKAKHTKTSKTLARYAYFSGLGFQMIAIIGLFTYAGYRVDQSSGAEKPIWTALLSLTGVCLSIYFVIRSVTRNNKS
ncbi:MAG TPA: AtpZ/AtpI family protein [Sphingobacteriaceae bacterium]|nr:AtpZ/AtpI family protein [Sphingobacteriaceae bacterium]